MTIFLALLIINYMNFTSPSEPFEITEEDQANEDMLKPPKFHCGNVDLDS